MDRARTILAIRVLLVLGVTLLAVGIVLAIRVLQGDGDAATTVWALSAAAVGILLLIPAGFALAMVGKAP
jgi:hypothetical protein